MLKISCARCGRIFNADFEHIGKSLRCSGCGDVVPIEGSDRQPGTAPAVRANAIPRAMPIKRQRTKRPKYRLGQFLRRKMLLVSLACTLAFALGLTSYLVWRGDKSPIADIGDPQSRTKQPPSSPPVEGPLGPPSSELPPVTNEQRFLPPTGTNLIPEAAHTGNGQLDAVNGTDSYARIVVVPFGTRRAVREVAIQAHETATLTYLSEGEYSVYFCNPGCFEFGKSLRYEETPTEDGRQYTRYTITLNPVPDGNVESRPISKEEFEMATGVRL